MRPFRNRKHAGQVLAGRLSRFQGATDAVVLGLPRGGVVVAFEIARALGLPLDVCIVRKLGVPWQPELAMGAVASGGVEVLHNDVIEQLGVPKQAVAEELALEKKELERREKAYRGEAPTIDLGGKTAIVVDDGIATGATAEAAVQALRKLDVRRIVLAVGVAPPSTCRRLESYADEVVAAVQPESMIAIGEWFEDFTQVSDEQVRLLLRDARAAQIASV